MANRYQFTTELGGFVQVYKDSGKFNNRCFSYTIPPATLAEVEADRVELLKWAKTKATGRSQVTLSPWDESGIVKYSYGQGDGSRKPKPEPQFFDKDGEPLDPEVLRKVHAGTKVSLIIQQKPYAMGGNVGTSLRVLGIQVLEIKTHESAQGDRDAYSFGDDHLSQDDLGALFKAAS